MSTIEKDCWLLHWKFSDSECNLEEIEIYRKYSACCVHLYPYIIYSILHSHHSYTKIYCICENANTCLKELQRNAFYWNYQKNVSHENYDGIFSHQYRLFIAWHLNKHFSYIDYMSLPTRHTTLRIERYTSFLLYRPFSNFYDCLIICVNRHNLRSRIVFWYSRVKRLLQP